MKTNSNSLSLRKNDVNSLLSLSSLFDGQFSIDWLEGLSGEKPSRILNAMEEGIQKGWLTRTGPAVFCFADRDKQQALENRIDQQQKTHLHRRIAELIMQDTEDDDRNFDALTQHLFHLPNNAEKCELLMQAGDYHLRHFRTEQALQCYDKALDNLHGIRDEKADLLFARSAIRYSKLSMARYDTKKVLAMLKEAMVRAEKITGHAHLSVLLKMHMAKNEWLSGRFRYAQKYFEEGWSSARKIDNPRLMRSVTAFRIFFLYWQGRSKEVIGVYEKAVPDVERFPQGRFSLMASMMAGFCYTYCGQTTQGIGMIDAIGSYCREKGDRYVFAYAQQAIGGLMLDIGQVDQGIPLLESALEEAIREHIGWVRLMTKQSLAYAFYLNNENKQAIALLREHLQQSRELHVNVSGPPLLELCLAMEEEKLPQIPDLQLSEEVRKGIRSKDIYFKGVAYRFQAYLHNRNKAPKEKILRSLNLSVQILEESGHQVQMARTRLELARYYLSLGKEDNAKKMAQMAHRIISPINDALFPDDLRPLVSEPPKSEFLLKEILQLGQETVTIRDSKEVVQHIISTVNRMTGAERGAIFLLNEQTDTPGLRLRASKGLTYEEVEDQSFKPSLEMIEEAIRAGKGFINQETSSRVQGDNVIRARICMPMILRDKPLGALYHDNRLLRSAFQASDLELLAYFAAQAAIAIDNAKAYEELQEQSDKLTEEKLYYKEQHLQSLHFEEIIGESPVIKKLLSQTDQVAATDTTVMILGETGVGKELLASAIHRHSPRNEGPLIRVNISALPESLVPSELFGHEKGAFTGAARRRSGRFELADGGSLFLDEIGDLSMEVQVGLLRVLQNNEFERLGGDKTLQSDFRLIVATNRDLEKEVRAGNFRADLYYRLNVFPVHVPPLRERMDDLPLLANYFLRIYSTKLRKKFKEINKAEMDKLIQYDWPGNVRELENMIERGAILSASPVFQAPDPLASPWGSSKQTDIISLEEVNRHHILMALRKTKWKIRGQGGAAELLDIKPTTLEYKIKKLGIQRPKALLKTL